jgi:hypothetical protein
MRGLIGALREIWELASLATFLTMIALWARAFDA